MEQQGGATSRLKRQAITMRKPYLDTAHAIQAEVLKRPLVGFSVWPDSGAFFTHRANSSTNLRSFHLLAWRALIGCGNQNSVAPTLHSPSCLSSSRLSILVSLPMLANWWSVTWATTDQNGFVWNATSHGRHFQCQASWHGGRGVNWSARCHGHQHPRWLEMGEKKTDRFRLPNNWTIERYWKFGC